MFLGLREIQVLLVAYYVNLGGKHVFDKETHAICSSRRAHRCLLLFRRKVNGIIHITFVYIYIYWRKLLINVFNRRRGLVTCGCDGDVRSWLNLMDDDPTTSCISEQAITAISKVLNNFQVIVITNKYFYKFFERNTASRKLFEMNLYT